MEAIGIFMWITAIFNSLGGLRQIADGEFNIYSVWAISANWLAVYYIEKSRDIK